MAKKHSSQTASEYETEAFNLLGIKNWEERESGKICIKQNESVLTPLWCDGWYKNPSSGRSHNYGFVTNNPDEHFTLIVKGGSFFLNEKCKDFFLENNVSLYELHGGISFEMAKKEHDIASLIQEKFKLSLNKKANCPEPIDVNIISTILDEKNTEVELIDFFLNSEKEKSGEVKFRNINFLKTATNLGIDIHYPMSEDAGEEIKKNPFHWVFSQCLEKAQQSVYRYKIDGPNTRILDLMTLDFSERQMRFIEANNAVGIEDAINKFCSKLGEFYGVLHKNEIGYHSKSSEHCTLVDITIAGVVMDIGGLSLNEPEESNFDSHFAEFFKSIGSDIHVLPQDVSGEHMSETYMAQVFKTTNLISYLCKNVFKTDEIVLKNAFKYFFEKYKNIYSDGNIEYFSENIEISDTPQKIRTKYLDHTSGKWMSLAPDLKHLDFV